MRELLPGSRLLIYIFSVFMILLLQKGYLLGIIALVLCFANLCLKNLSRTWKIFLYASPFIFTAVILGLFQGTAGGSLAVIMIFKLMCITLLNSLMFRNFKESDLILALSQLRFPELISSIIFFIFRYQELFSEEVGQLKLARKLRGGRIGRRGFNLPEYALLGQVIGAGLVRALERGERVYQAMRLRGIRVGVLVKSSRDLTEKDLSDEK